MRADHKEYEEKFTSIYKEYQKIGTFLKPLEINPILYGSAGVGVYLGNFKKFEDLDLLIEDKWITDKWGITVKRMADNGFKLINQREHEFESSDGLKVALAPQSILERDGIGDLETDVTELTYQGIPIRTLFPQTFLKAYEFSAKDGYRRDTRGKKDSEIITKLQNYIINESSK
ncbi:hypothetical protein BH09PAT1_BH09PAT1_0630 [soil metagenome]